MAKWKVLSLFCVFLFLLSACVSKGKYLELESDLVETRKRADMGEENLHSLQEKFDAWRPITGIWKAKTSNWPALLTVCRKISKKKKQSFKKKTRRL